MSGPKTSDLDDMTAEELRAYVKELWAALNRQRTPAETSAHIHRLNGQLRNARSELNWWRGKAGAAWDLLEAHGISSREDMREAVRGS